MKLAVAKTRNALRCATDNSSKIVRALARAAHGPAAHRGTELLTARRLARELLDKIDAAGAEMDTADTEETAA